MDKKSGFTLVEILIVVAIIAIIAVIALPNVQKHIWKAKQTATQAAIEQLSVSITQFYNDVKMYPDPYNPIIETMHHLYIIGSMRIPSGELRTVRFVEDGMGRTTQLLKKAKLAKMTLSGKKLLFMMVENRKLYKNQETAGRFWILLISLFSIFRTPGMMISMFPDMMQTKLYMYQVKTAPLSS